MKLQKKKFIIQEGNPNCQPHVGRFTCCVREKKEMEMRILLAIVMAASLAVAAGCSNPCNPCNPCAPVVKAPAPVVCNPCAGL